MKTKEELLKKENNCLSNFAARSNNPYLSKKLYNEEDDGDLRLSFQRDRDRIIHSRAFRRLMHKTQVFNANKGDHYRNRLTHTLEVCQISRSIGKNLDLNEELIEAIALGHDLGHTPFGHIGERTLHNIIHGNLKQEIDINHTNFGGFKHNFQSLQVIDNIESSSEGYKGLNLTLAVRDGILKHTGNKIKCDVYNKTTHRFELESQEISYASLNLENLNVDMPSITLEGQIVAISDEIAQCTHDLEDGIRAGIIKLNDIKQNKIVLEVSNKYDINLDLLVEPYIIRNTLIKHMIGYLVNSVCEESEKLIKLNYENNIPTFSSIDDVYKINCITLSQEIYSNLKELQQLITKLVISSQEVSQSDSKAEILIKKIFRAYYIHPQQLPDYVLKRYFIKTGREFNRNKLEEMKMKLISDGDFVRLICDHIASMTDQYAAREYKKLYEPEFY
jgi:dGTPase